MFISTLQIRPSQHLSLFLTGKNHDHGLLKKLDNVERNRKPVSVKVMRLDRIASSKERKKLTRKLISPIRLRDMLLIIMVPVSKSTGSSVTANPILAAEKAICLTSSQMSKIYPIKTVKPKKKPTAILPLNRPKLLFT